MKSFHHSVKHDSVLTNESILSVQISEYLPCILCFQLLVSFWHQVQGVQEEAAKLIVAYSGDRARDIQRHEMEVVNAWRNLQVHVDVRKNRLGDSSDLHRFFGMVRDLLLWMNDMRRQMTKQEKPR